jgi:glycosyltransferase involved in cell wall biosynthesis
MINIIAVNIKTGGGKNLLFELINHVIKTNTDVVFHLDLSLKQNLSEMKILDKCSFVFYKGFIHKLKLFLKIPARAHYFGNIPPLSFGKKKYTLYFQNYNYLLSFTYLLKNKQLKVLLQKIYLKIFISNSSNVFVQTSLVADKFEKVFGFKPSVLPFFSHLSPNKKIIAKCYDFIYPALSTPNKNHIFLFHSLKELDTIIDKKINIVLTITDELLRNLLTEINYEFNNIEIVNFGEVSQSKIYKLMKQSKVLVFTSKFESFGLPLIEAFQLGLPIISPKIAYADEIISTKYSFEADNYFHLTEILQQTIEGEELCKSQLKIKNNIFIIIEKI